MIIIQIILSTLLVINTYTMEVSEDQTDKIPLTSFDKTLKLGCNGCWMQKHKDYKVECKFFPRSPILYHFHLYKNFKNKLYYLATEGDENRLYRDLIYIDISTYTTQGNFYDRRGILIEQRNIKELLKTLQIDPLNPENKKTNQ